jgi:hypothetical protein
MEKLVTPSLRARSHYIGNPYKVQPTGTSAVNGLLLAGRWATLWAWRFCNASRVLPDDLRDRLLAQVAFNSGFIDHDGLT